MNAGTALKKSIRRWLIFFTIALLVSGLTAFPLETGLDFLLHHLPCRQCSFYIWLKQCYLAIVATNRQFPFLAYGYDWLAFAHIVLAVFFLGPIVDPVRNIWVMQAGCLACIMVFPLAFVAGYFRQIPIGWQLIDCSFGAIGIIPLLVAITKTRQLERLKII